MGPRLVSRGNMAYIATPAVRGKWLQWGRDSLVAEMRQKIGRDHVSGLASMGPRLVSRGNPLYRASRGRLTDASMGPRLVSRGNVSFRPHFRRFLFRFNGAATR